MIKHSQLIPGDHECCCAICKEDFTSEKWNVLCDNCRERPTDYGDDSRAEYGLDDE